jgi:hypothetical protein
LGTSRTRRAPRNVSLVLLARTQPRRALSSVLNVRKGHIARRATLSPRHVQRGLTAEKRAPRQLVLASRAQPGRTAPAQGQQTQPRVLLVVTVLIVQRRPQPHAQRGCTAALSAQKLLVLASPVRQARTVRLLQQVLQHRVQRGLTATRWVPKRLGHASCVQRGHTVAQWAPRQLVLASRAQPGRTAPAQGQQPQPRVLLVVTVLIVQRRPQPHVQRGCTAALSAQKLLVLASPVQQARTVRLLQQVFQHRVQRGRTVTQRQCKRSALVELVQRGRTVLSKE